MIHHDGSSVTSRAYEFIRTRVLARHYPPGQRLVTRQIAQELGASLNPVREAIGRLAAEGLIDHIPGAGAFVRQPSPEDLLELYELRQAIEPFAARKAAASITEPELGLLRKLCDLQHQTVQGLERSGGTLDAEGLDRWLSLEERFHENLIRAARNRHFDRTIAHSRVLTQLFSGHRALGIQVDHSIAERTWIEHARLVEALERHDGEAAAKLMLDALVLGAQSALASITAPRKS